MIDTTEPTQQDAEMALRHLTADIVDAGGAVIPGTPYERDVLLVARYLQGRHRALSAHSERQLGRFLEYMFRT